jgi:hypothetical protein
MHYKIAAGTRRPVLFNPLFPVAVWYRDGAVRLSREGLTMRTCPVDLPDLSFSPRPHASDSEDAHLAGVYINMWTAISGRSLPRGIPPCQLSRDTLIWFWADDLFWADDYCSGRHAASGAVPAGGRR